MYRVTVKKDESGRILVSFQYNPSFIQKVKSIKGHRWHPLEKYWGFPNTDRILEKILKSFEGKEIHLDPALKGSENISSPQSPLSKGVRGLWGEGQSLPPKYLSGG
mgnify:CR=1 FL=1